MKFSLIRQLPKFASLTCSTYKLRLIDIISPGKKLFKKRPKTMFGFSLSCGNDLLNKSETAAEINMEYSFHASSA